MDSLQYTRPSILTNFPIPAGYGDHESYYFLNYNDHEVYDTYDLFRFYNAYFFHGILDASEVKWSTRMTLCAGTCQLQAPGSCLITLSKSLLQFRTSKDLKETLIHEMIHGYLFITNYKACHDRNGHGDEFCTIMNNINAITGLNISVYHSFHDEVEFFRKHVWKCNGPCQYQKPFYGIVKRAMNRAPGKGDYWWEKHQKECGGTYIKIEGPEFNPDGTKKPEVVKKKRKAKDPVNTIDDFFKKTKTTGPMEIEGECEEIVKKEEKKAESNNNNIPKAFVFLLSKEEAEKIKKGGFKRKSISEKQEKQEASSQKVTKPIESYFQTQTQTSFTEYSSTNFTTQNVNITSQVSQVQSSSGKKSANLMDFMKSVLDSPDSSSPITNDRSYENSNTEKAFSLDQYAFQRTPPPAKIDRGLSLESQGSDTNKLLDSGFRKASELSEELVYCILIKGDRTKGSDKFWARILINSECYFALLLEVWALIDPIHANTDGLELVKKGESIYPYQKLKDMNLRGGDVIEEKAYAISFQMEKVFFNEAAKNLNVLKARSFPVCVGICVFKDNDQPYEDSKERMSKLNSKLMDLI